MSLPIRKHYPVIILFFSVLQFGCDGSESSSSPNSNSGPGDESDGSLSSEASTGKSFITFDSGQVRPLALANNGDRLLATNTPNGSLDILTVTDSGLQLEHEVPVGMEPVAVAVFKDKQAWVVNHLSDSISIVDLATDPPRVIDTLLVGDEPRDIVFAGEDKSLAYVTTAHRGQNGPDDQPIDAQLFTPSVGRADVWVFDANNRGASLGGDPTSVVSLFGDTPRALAVSPDGTTVYVAVMHSGNRTTAIGENQIAKAGPIQSGDGEMQPDTGLIVGFDGSQWRDGTGATADLNTTSYASQVRFSLPDYDVFAISATVSPSVLNQYSGVGTSLFNMEINPVSGVVYVSNTEALNLTRFEGAGNASTTVRGNIAQSRITVIDNLEINTRDLNKHLDHDRDAASEDQRNLSVVQPLGMAVSADGSTLYVAGFGSESLAVYDTGELENNSFQVSGDQQITLSAGGPTGVILDEARSRLYTMTRFNNSVVTIETVSNTEVASVALFNPEPQDVIEGRPFLYNAKQHSSHGDASCGLCHMFADVDALAWDLGNPDESVVSNPNRFVNILLVPETPAVFHPMKGPMTTQSLRGLANNGPMHWRGDRTGQNAADDESIESAAFKEFNIAFPQLLGRTSELSEEEMEAFTEFALQIDYPPNPIRALDNSLTESQAEGQRIYMQEETTADSFTCNDCHRVDPENRQFGTNGQSSVEGDDISQEFKVPHLRNMYQKVGKFGNTGRFAGSDTQFGDQIKGFGFMHDGNMDTVDNFLKGSVFSFETDTVMDDLKRGQVADFVMAMDSDLAPIVGQQITLSAASGNDSAARLDLLLQRAAVASPRSECDLIAKGVMDDEPRGFLMKDNGMFQSDKKGESYDVEQIKALSRQTDSAITFTCVPPGSGVRMGIDRNEDGISNGDDILR